VVDFPPGSLPQRLCNENYRSPARIGRMMRQAGGGNGRKLEYPSLTTGIFIYSCIGLFAGFMSGLFGIGGGAVRIPLLNFTGLLLLAAFTINLWTIPFASAIASIEQKHRIDMRIAVRMVVGGTFGSVAGGPTRGADSPTRSGDCFRHCVCIDGRRNPSP